MAIRDIHATFYIQNIYNSCCCFILGMMVVVLFLFSVFSSVFICKLWFVSSMYICTLHSLLLKWVFTYMLSHFLSLIYRWYSLHSRAFVYLVNVTKIDKVPARPCPKDERHSTNLKYDLKSHIYKRHDSKLSWTLPNDVFFTNIICSMEDE